MNKKELTSYVLNANKNLHNIGIKTGKISDVKINSRATKRFGMCEETNNNEFTIEISKFILDDKQTLKNTVYHELLHTVEGCMNHGKKWQMLALSANKELGINISRTGTATAEMKEAQLKKIKYIITCNSCGNSWKRQRKSKLVENPEVYSCGCGGDLKVKYL